MKSLKNTIPFFVLVACIAWSCETIIDVDLPEHEPLLVVNSYFGTDTTFTFDVSLSKDILDDDMYNDSRSISGVDIEIFEDGTSIGKATQTEEYESYKLYYYPKPESQYSIRASRSGQPVIQSQDVIPRNSSKPEVEKVLFTSNEWGDQVTRFTYSFEDPAGTNYYEVLLYLDQPMYEYYEDEDTSYHYINGTFKEQLYYNNVGADLNEFEDTGDITLFSDELFDGKQHSQTIEFYYYPYNYDGQSDLEESQLHLEVRSVSEAYYKYRVSRTLQQDAEDNPFAEAAQVYNNIEGGFGIFAGYNSQTLTFTIDPDE